jgi:hypothetical protein
VLLIGLAFAGPIVRPARAPIVRIVMLDRSGAVAQPDSGAVIAASVLREGDVLVPFDTVATAVAWADGQSVPQARQAPGDLAAALLVAMREARAVAARADSIELVLISPIDAAAWSPATLPVRAEWPGAIRIERLPAAALDSSVWRIDLRADADDPLAATVALLGGAIRAPGGARVSRDAPTAADTAWARDSGGVLVHWPSGATSVADSATALLGSGAVIARDAIAVAPWARGARPEGRPIAWWVDGAPAAGESPLGTGCVRRVAIGMPAAGDVALRPSTQHLLRALTGPCGAPARLGPVPDTLVRRLAGSGGLVSGTRVVRAGVQVSPATPWLLLAGLALLALEWLVRNRMVRP